MHLRTRDSSFIFLNLIIHLQGVRAITPDMRLPLSPKEGPGTIYYGISTFFFFLFSYGFSAAILLKKALLFPTTGFEL